MIAIVFWSVRSPECPAGKFEKALLDFHEVLNQNRAEGFRRSVSFRVESEIPWIGADTPPFEDWYLLSNFAALDALDRLVMSDQGLESHAFLMENTGQAAATALYLQRGTAYVERNRLAYWFNKPPGVSTEGLSALAGKRKSGSHLWTRALALGPKANCLLSNAPITLPADWHPVAARRSVHWAP